MCVFFDPNLEHFSRESHNYAELNKSRQSGRRMSDRKKIYILGGSQSDFSRKLNREGKEISDLFKEVLLAGLEATLLDPQEIETCHVGNFAAELFCGQGHLGGFFAQSEPALIGLPAMRHEAACASGSMAILSATAELEAERYGLACVLGIEVMRNQTGEEAARHLGAAAWAGHEFTATPWVWPSVFAEMMALYDKRYGLDESYLSAISQQNFEHAKLNPNSQTRSWTFTDLHFARGGELNPIIAGRLRRQDCSQITDGAAVLFLATEERAKRYAQRRGQSLSDLPYIEGWGHRVTQLGFEEKLIASEGAPHSHLFPEVHQCFQDAYRRAGISGVHEIDGLETHDCFSITQYMAIDHCGLTQPGRSHLAIEEGWTQLGGRFPINPSGGLIGLGHPVGATGVRMLLDAAKQVRGTAGAYQSEGARRWMTYNVGGSTTTSAVFIVRRGSE